MTDEYDIEDEGDPSSTLSAAAALALALLASSWRASFFDDSSSSSSSSSSLGAPPVLRSWAFAATVSALHCKGYRKNSRRCGEGNSWALAAARLSLLTLSSPTELAALVSGAMRCSSSDAVAEAVVSQTVSWALKDGGDGDESVIAVAAAAAAAAAAAGAAAATTGRASGGIVPPLARFLRERLRSSSSNESSASAAAVAAALDELLASGGGSSEATSSLSRLAASLADAVASLSGSTPSSSAASAASRSLLASLCRLRARLALCGVVACERGDEEKEGEEDDGTERTNRGASKSLPMLWATMLSPPPPLSSSFSKPPRTLICPPSDRSLAAAASCVAALPGSPLRPWKDDNNNEVYDGDGHGDGHHDVELALAAAVPLRDSAHPTCRVAAAAACWLHYSSASSPPNLLAALEDVALSAASSVGEEDAQRAMVDAVADAKKKSSRLTGSRSPSRPKSSLVGAARAAVTAVANRSRVGSELTPAIIAAALVARSEKDLDLSLEDLVSSGAADADAGELVSAALAGAWPRVSQLLALREVAREEECGYGDDPLCRLLWSRVPEEAANIAAFVGFVTRLAGGEGDGDGGKGGESEARPSSPPPLSPSRVIERIVLRTLEDPRKRESDAALASAAKLGVRLLLVSSSSDKGAKMTTAADGLAPSLLLKLLKKACELFAEQREGGRGGGGKRKSSLSPATSALCGELAAKAAAAAAAAAPRGKALSPPSPPSLPWRAKLSAPSLLLLPEELPPSLLATSSNEPCSAVFFASDLLALAWGSAEGEEAVLRAAAADAAEGGGNAEEATAVASSVSLLLSRLRSFGIRASHAAIERELARVLPLLSLAESERLTLRALPAMLRATTTAAAANATSSALASLPRSAFRALSIAMLCRVAGATAEVSPESYSSLIRAALRAATAAARSGPPALARRALAEAAALVSEVKKKQEEESKEGDEAAPSASAAVAAAAAAAIPSLLQMITCVLAPSADENADVKQKQRRKEEVVAWVRAAVVAVADDGEGTLAAALKWHEGRW